MRSALFVLILCAGCKAPSGVELSRSQCADLVRHVQSLTADDNSELRASQTRLRADIEGCLANGTEKAYRCVMQAEQAKDLEICDSLFR